MGMNLALHLGVYIKAKMQITTEERIDNVCPFGHKDGKDKPFCPVCGEKTIEQKTPVEEIWCLNDLMNNDQVPWKFEEDLYSTTEYKGEYEILITNKRGIDLAELDGDLELEDADPMLLIEEFKEKHEELISIIEPLYDTFEIHYGVVSDYR